ncbi:hypothetical protein CERSUDRAFT_135051 [Gelatoporia subvermispora B]|uniref:Mitochondrial carrier protein n=1 Tax=Ceriporiopsis subvermispora (strain B) TaxID=914234 RepID=M2QMS1_CERS8|nr:hypothetical protein CERSUDRAFT_135051 [Gelatoporia subvermispora B]
MPAGVDPPQSLQVESSSDAQDQQPNSLYAALARTATRSIALYFSRPVRLFRPSKVSGWQTLKGLASHHGMALSPRYLAWLVRQQGFMVIPKHFIPPILVNGVLGVVLWSTYSEVSDMLTPHLSSYPTALAAVSGGVAGGVQALVAAPAENVRFALEGASAATGWSHAWKEVFRGTEGQGLVAKDVQVREARQVREWMREVGDMAGRGWNGWGWGCVKDICGFAVFFSIFDLTRRAAFQTKTAAQSLVQNLDTRYPSLCRHAPRISHATTLVTGGVIAGLSYEVACRPWDAARKVVHIHRVAQPSQSHSSIAIVLQKVQEDGILSFFRGPNHGAYDKSLAPLRRRMYSAVRTLARVGPWGAGFLVWEAFGPGIS